MKELEKKFGKPLVRKAVSLPAVQRIVREEIARKFIETEIVENSKLTVNEVLFLEKMITEEIMTPELAYRILKENVTEDIKSELVAVAAKLRRQMQMNGIDDASAKQAATSWVKKVIDLANSIQGEAQQLSMQKPKFRVATDNDTQKRIK